LRFEDLVNRGTGQLEALLAFSGGRRDLWPDLELFYRAPVNAKTMHQPFADAEGAADFAAALERHCGVLARRFGYQSPRTSGA
jgi:hypothetical protein